MSRNNRVAVCIDRNDHIVNLTIPILSLSSDTKRIVKYLFFAVIDNVICLDIQIPLNPTNAISVV